MSFVEVGALVGQLNWPAYRGRQLLDWVYKKGVGTPAEMTNLSLKDRQTLLSSTFISQIHPATKEHAEDGARKYLFELSDGCRIETVLIPDAAGHRQRLTLCLSTQAGCTLDCAFCRTGRMGLLRNLKAHEIVDQFLTVQRDLRDLKDHRTIRNVVLMGMGEPLANFNEVVEAIRRLTSPQAVGFPARRITLSTAGLVPQIKKLGELSLGVKLAVSLNASTDPVRDRLMGTVNRKYPIGMLLKACREYPLSPRERLTFEYVLIKNINDSSSDAKRLTRCLRGIRCKVNLIPYNPYPESAYERPEEKTVLSFQQALKKASLKVFVRKSKGRDIQAACGQLLTPEPLTLKQNC